jgi:multiple sugar transport system ATP-binding protein
VARLVLANLRKSFPGPSGQVLPAVQDLSLTVGDREVVVLLGPSGCGKTTTLRLIAGLEQPDAGGIHLDGRPIHSLSPGDRDVALVFQHHALYPHLTVFENLAFGLRLRQVPRAEIDQRVRQTAGLLGLDTCLSRRPAALSGGERQRVALGRALVRRPAVFLLDEPLSNLDAPLRVQMRREIAQLQRRLGTPMLYVTHDQNEALALGDRVAVLRDGALEQVGTPGEIYAEPATRFVAGFVGWPPMNFLGGRLVARNGALHFEGPGASFALRIPPEGASALGSWTDREVTLGLRPEHLSVPPGLPATRSVGHLAGQVESVEPIGPETHLQVRLGEQSLTVRAPAGTNPVVGQTIELEVEVSRASFFDPATGRAVR